MVASGDGLICILTGILYPDALTTLGIVYYRIKRLDDDVKFLTTVVAGGEANSDAAYMLALVGSDRGKPGGAAAPVKTALSAPGRFVFRNEARRWLDRLPAAKAR